MAPKRIYVYDGANLQIYDPQTDSWTNGTAPPTSRQYLGITVVDDCLYFIGGMSFPFPDIHSYYVFHAANERYTPVGYGSSTVAPTEPPSISEFLVIAPVALLVVVGVAVYLKRHRR